MKEIRNVCNKTLLAFFLVILFQLMATMAAGDSVTVMAENSEEAVKFCFSYHPPMDDDFVVIPVGYNFVFTTSDVWKEGYPEGIKYEDCITIDNEEVASINGAYLVGKKEGETSLHYRCGIKKGDLAIRVVPNLDIEATGQEAELTDGKIKYHVALKNNSKSDVVIEGFNLGGSIGDTAFVGLPWVRQEVVLKAGETGDVSFLSDMNPYKLTEDDCANREILPPAIYVKYEGAYFLISLKDFSPDKIQYKVSYYDSTTLEQYINRVTESNNNEDEDDEDDSGDNSNENLKSNEKVVIKSVKAVVKRQLKVKWNKVSDATGYQVQYALDKAFVKDRHMKNTKETSITIKKLKGGTKYYVRIRCYKEDGGKKIYGKWSKVKSCRTK